MKPGGRDVKLYKFIMLHTYSHIVKTLNKLSLRNQEVIRRESTEECHYLTALELNLV